MAIGRTAIGRLRPWRAWLLPSLAVVVGLTAGAVGTAQQARVPVVVELFTSEGCSSCPPADRLLADLVGRQPVKGALVVGLSEHVDYWNELGWRDPFSSVSFSRRQSDYAATAHAADVYTPQMIVDGGERLVGSDRSAALAAIARAVSVPKAAVHLTWMSDPRPTLDVALDANRQSAGATVLLAVTEDGLTSVVTRGENGGRSLTHSGVTRRLVEIGTVGRDGAFHATRSIDLDPAWRRPALRVIVFAQKRGEPRITAAGAIEMK